MIIEPQFCFSSFIVDGSSYVIRPGSLADHHCRRDHSLRGRGILRALFLALLVALISSPLPAQTIDAFLSAGTTSLFNKYSFVEYNNAYHSDYTLGPEITIGGEGHLTSLLGIELSAELGRNTLHVTNSNSSTEWSYGIDKERASADMVVHIPGTLLHGKPYLVVGPEFDRLAPYGLAASPSTTPGFLNDPFVYLHSNDKIGFNVGGGLEMKLASKLGLRLDLRDHTFTAPRYGVPSYATTGAYFPVQGSINNVEFSVGLVYHFGL